MQCGRITVHPDNGKLLCCQQEARWLSPKRIRTEGQLKVCGEHKGEMTEEYKGIGRGALFTILA